MNRNFRYDVKADPSQIFQVLLQHEKIRECAVVGKPDETWGEKAHLHYKLEHLSNTWHGHGQVTAVCVLESGAQLTIKDTVGLQST